MVPDAPTPPYPCEPHQLVVELANALLPHEGLSPPAATESDPQIAADALANAQEIPELIIFTGFLGGTISQPRVPAGEPDKQWRVLYLDWRLLTWLIVETEAIVYASRITDDKVPFNERDLIWVRADASVHRGTGHQAAETRFLRGDFTRAGDLSASLTGGTFSPSTGIFCEATTAGCCGKYTRH
jgi:hypothetical protein